MSLLSLLLGPPKRPAPIDPFWRRNGSLKYPTLVSLATRPQELRGYGGVFVVWHIGVQGRWVYCGHSPALDEAALALFEAPTIREWEQRGALVFTWAPVREDRRDGVVAYLRDTLPFEIKNEGLDERLGMAAGRLATAQRVPVLPPG
ncbi:hypothetical protein [Pararhodospirillum oryzae]|nr:hypothetical protein [Pararhodospirillum oryzae]